MIARANATTSPPPRIVVPGLTRPKPAVVVPRLTKPAACSNVVVPKKVVRNQPSMATSTFTARPKVPATRAKAAGRQAVIAVKRPLPLRGRMPMARGGMMMPPRAPNPLGFIGRGRGGGSFMPMRRGGFYGRPSTAPDPFGLDVATKEDMDFIDDDGNENEPDWRTPLRQVTKYDPTQFGADRMGEATETDLILLRKEEHYSALAGRKEDLIEYRKLQEMSDTEEDDESVSGQND